MADWLTYSNSGATRNQPLSSQLVDALSFLGDMGVTANVFSGGQPHAGEGPRVGSTRHDAGMSGDITFMKDGRVLDWNNPQDVPIFQEIVRRGKARGITGFGAGPGYMSAGSMHIGFGAPAVWGAGGKSANAPDWLREAYGVAPQGTTTTMSSSGYNGGPLVDQYQTEQPQQRGIMGLLSDPERRAKLALVLNNMTLNPNQGINALMQERLTEAAGKREMNRTAQWLASQGRDDLAQAVMSGALDGKSAVGLFYQKPEDTRTEAAKNYEYLVAHGVAPEEAQARAFGAPKDNRTETAKNYEYWLSQGKSPEEAQALAVGAPKDNRTSMIQNYEYWLSQGKSPEEAQALARAGAGGVNIDMSGGGKFEEGFAKMDAEKASAVFDAGLSASRNLGSINQLEQLLAAAPSGIEGGLAYAASKFGYAAEGAEPLQAAQAIISALVPQQRPPGSGTMSDADLELFKQSLPSIMNQPGGNAIILNTMRAIAEYDIEGAKIVQQLRAQEIDRATAFKLLMERPNPLAGLRGATPSAGTTAAPAGGSLSPDAQGFIVP